MNIYLHELKQYRNSTFIWVASVSAIAILFFMLFPSLYKEGEAFQKILQNFPEAVRKALGVSVDFMTSFLGLYAFIFLYLLICGAVQAMMLGSSVLAKEMTGKTADFLMSKPVTRSHVLTAKLLAVLTCILFTNVVFAAVVSAAAPIWAPTSYDSGTFYLMTATLLPFQLVFVAMGILISASVRKLKSPLSISLAIPFGFFIIGSLGEIIGEEKVRYLSPFKHFNYEYIIKNGTLEWQYLIVDAVFIVMAVVLTYMIYHKKDIHAVS